MLNVYGLESSKWPEEMKKNLETYEMWRSELVKDLSSIRKVYKKH